ncbi:MAG: hypothetical protein JSU86_09270 [Phycisphaerales bacterium]|nr:MAG: hypothetical protein JSU86_09270 [Phycisphaerales bacterium]
MTRIARRTMFAFIAGVAFGVSLALIGLLIQPGTINPSWQPTAAQQLIGALHIPGLLACSLTLGGPDTKTEILVCIGANCLFYGILLAVPVLIAADYHRHCQQFRREEGLCITCGYNLTGNVSGICPECGTTIEKP